VLRHLFGIGTLNPWRGTLASAAVAKGSVSRNAALSGQSLKTTAPDWNF
jgi:hypothetical protein